MRQHTIYPFYGILRYEAEKCKENKFMVDELCHAFELAQQQSEAVQRYIAELVTQELAGDELEVSPELAEELETAHDEIAAGDVRDYEVYRKDVYR